MGRHHQTLEDELIIPIIDNVHSVMEQFRGRCYLAQRCNVGRVTTPSSHLFEYHSRISPRLRVHRARQTLTLKSVSKIITALPLSWDKTILDRDWISTSPPLAGISRITFSVNCFTYSKSPGICAGTLGLLELNLHSHPAGNRDSRLGVNVINILLIESHPDIIQHFLHTH